MKSTVFTINVITDAYPSHIIHTVQLQGKAGSIKKKPTQLQGS